LKTKLKQINTLVVLFDYIAWLVCLCCGIFYLIVVWRATCVD
jgi:hypothetical protein